MADFLTKYPSILHAPETVSKTKEQNTQGQQFVATEKVHGANFCFILTPKPPSAQGEGVTREHTGPRTSFLVSQSSCCCEVRVTPLILQTDSQPEPTRSSASLSLPDTKVERRDAGEVTKPDHDHNRVGVCAPPANKGVGAWDVSGACRSRVLREDETFHHWQRVREDNLKALCEIARLVAEDSAHEAPLSAVLVYGELFGGHYPGLPQTYEGGRVQVGVAYSPGTHFYAFDIAVSRPEDEGRQGERQRCKVSYLPFERTLDYCARAGIGLYAKPLAQGTLREMLTLDIEPLRSQLPKWLGLPELPGGSPCEGIVVRAASGCKRHISKRVHAAFAETILGKGKGKHKDEKRKVAQSTARACTEQASAGLTEMRLDKVRLNRDPDHVNDEEKLAKLLSADALEAYLADRPDTDAAHDVKVSTNLYFAALRLVKKTATERRGPVQR